MDWTLFFADIQKPLTALLIATLTGLGGLVARYFAKASKAVEVKTDAIKNETERDLVKHLSAVAYAYIRAKFKDYNGAQKLEEAKDYVQRQLAMKGISITDEDLEGVIEKARLEYKNAAAAANNPPITVTADTVVQKVE